MITEKELIDYYKKISNQELLEILDNPKDYQMLALKVAKQEFLNRQLTEEEVNIARQAQINKKLLKAKGKQNFEPIENNTNASDSKNLDTLSSTAGKEQGLDKTLLLIIVLFSLVAILQITSNYSMLKYSLRDFKRHPLLAFVTAFPIVILPIALIIFSNRKRIGWILLAIYITFCATDSALLLVQHFTIDSIIRLIFFVGTLLLICNKKISETYSVSKKRKEITIIATVLLTLVTSLGAVL
jgi:hypothetical protein